MSQELSLSELTQIIQDLVGTKTDGIWGKKTAKAVLETLRPSDKNEQEPCVPEEPTEPVEPTDLITPNVHRICNEVINVFETGSKAGNYADVTIYKDGGQGAYRQITYGKAGSTQDGTLDVLLANYITAAQKEGMSSAAKVIQSYLPIKNNRSLVDNKEFIQALKDAGKEPVMKEVQDQFFDDAYWAPALRWFKSNGFTLPLSMLVIFDSFIHSGGILDFLRKRFKAVPPAAGGDEKEWITQYVSTRKSWLANHSNTILRKTTYRMDTMQRAISAGNWNLTSPLNANGVIVS